jgi:hypothetical protein
MPEERRDRIGRFCLKKRGKRGIWHICWTDESRRPQSLSTGTNDHAKAQDALARHALENGEIATEAKKAGGGPQNPTVAVVFLHYYKHKKSSGDFASEHVFKSSMGDAARVWGDIRVNELDIPKQKELIAHWRAEPIADSTIDAICGPCGRHLIAPPVTS